MNQTKRKRPKLKKISVNPKQQWRELLREVDKDDIPVDLLLSICVNLVDGTTVKIDVKELLKEIGDPEVLGKLLDSKFQSLDEYIQNIDFYVSIDELARTVQPITDKILKDL